MSIGPFHGVKDRPISMLHARFTATTFTATNKLAMSSRPPPRFAWMHGGSRFKNQPIGTSCSGGEVVGAMHMIPEKVKDKGHQLASTRCEKHYYDMGPQPMMEPGPGQPNKYCTRVQGSVIDHKLHCRNY